MISTRSTRSQVQTAANQLTSGDTGIALDALQNTLRAPNSGYHASTEPLAGALRNLNPRFPEPQWAAAVDLAVAMSDFFRDMLILLVAPLARQSLETEPNSQAEYRINGNPKSEEDAIKFRGQFLEKSFTNHAGARGYKLYIPGSYDGQPMPLVVMLHGCTQDPDDFAAGTRMNAVAEANKCFVVYPAQAQSANSSKCWNWFNSSDQQRGKGEPSIIAGITQEVVRKYRLDASRVYVAGLSSGGAMAVIMAIAYPDLYAAIGVHSGLPYASARDLPSAFAAMRGTAAGLNPQSLCAIESGKHPTPMIIFHGDCDTTVDFRNGAQLMNQNTRRPVAAGREKSGLIIDQGQVPNGRHYTCTTHQHGDGRIVAEHWVVHGAGHAWAGGSQYGSFTDPGGPDATQEMIRFFYTQINASSKGYGLKHRLKSGPVPGGGTVGKAILR